jgi:hypothetical protein
MRRIELSNEVASAFKAFGVDHLQCEQKEDGMYFLEYASKGYGGTSMDRNLVYAISQAFTHLLMDTDIVSHVK